MSAVTNPQIAGNIIKRVREDRGLSRAKLAVMTNIGVRTLYALEKGESENFGLGNYLKLLSALGLAMEVNLVTPLPQQSPRTARRPGEMSSEDQITLEAVNCLPGISSQWEL